MVAQNLALLRPDLVSSLVLISTSCKSAPSLRDNMEARIAAMDKMGPEAAAGIAAESIFSPGWRAANPAALARFIAWRSVMPSAPLNAATRALYEFNLSNDLPRDRRADPGGGRRRGRADAAARHGGNRRPHSGRGIPPDPEIRPHDPGGAARTAGCAARHVSASASSLMDGRFNQQP
jgi:pimeloyl-ACP methyl ester carboxylesterase